MAKLLFAGGRLCSFRPIAPGGGETTSLSYNHAYSVCTVLGGTLQADCFDPADAPLLTPYSVPGGHSLFFHSTYSFGDGMRNSDYGLYLVDSSGNPWIRWGSSDASSTLMEIWHNSGTGGSPVWTSFGHTQPMVGYGSGYVSLDIKIDIAASGPHTMLLAIDGNQYIGPFTFTSSFTSLAGAQLFSTVGTSYGWSEVMMTEDLSTIGGHVATTVATGAGTDANWTGAYTGVNEVPVNDTTINQATAANLKQTYPQTNIAVPAGYVIPGVFSFFRAKNGGTPPENLKAICRPASTDHISADLGTIGVTWTSVGARYDVNPETSAAWTQSDWNAPTQLGFESDT